MKFPFYDFNSLHHDSFRKEVLSRFEEIVAQNAFVEGKYNDLFESEFAKIQSNKNCLLVANGTDALEISLQACGVKPGDLVGIPGISFFATAEAVINQGATPIFIDVEETTGLMCPKSLERTLAKHNLKAIIPVHIYGQPANLEAIESLCGNKVKIIEDAAQAQGAFEKRGPIGASNNYVTFSFYPTKNLGAFGDAGAILIQSDEEAEKIRSIRNHGRSPNGHALIGRNSRCDHLQAAVLHLKLKDLEVQNKRRKEIATVYHQNINRDYYRTSPDQYLETSSWHLYPVGLPSTEKKTEFINYLKQNEIGFGLFYQKSLPQETPLKNIEGEVENANRFADTTLCLPMNPFLSDDQIVEVCTLVNNFV